MDDMHFVILSVHVCSVAIAWKEKSEFHQLTIIVEIVAHGVCKGCVDIGAVANLKKNSIDTDF